MKYLSHQFQHTIQIKKSEFITTVFPVTSAQEAEAHIAKMKHDFPNATHHCSAYLIKTEQTVIKKAYDDGEPSKTAGIPILRSIEYSEFENILVIVTRYFGGIKLGAGGLIRAYGQAAKETLLLAPFHIPKMYVEIELAGNVGHFGSLNNTLLALFTIEKAHTLFQENQFSMTFFLPHADLEHFQTVVENQFHSITLQKNGTRYI